MVVVDGKYENEEPDELPSVWRRSALEPELEGKPAEAMMGLGQRMGGPHK